MADPTQVSQKYQLNKIDLEKILEGALVAAGGAVLTYAAQEIGNINFGPETPLIVAVASILLNVGRKWLQG